MKVSSEQLPRGIAKRKKLTVSNERHRDDLQLSLDVRVEELVVEEMIRLLLPLGEILDLILVTNWIEKQEERRSEREGEGKKGRTSEWRSEKGEGGLGEESTILTVAFSSDV